MSSPIHSSMVTALLGDPRLERMLTIGNEMNDYLSKIQAASKYLLADRSKEDLEAVGLAREELVRELVRDSEEARQLLPALDEIVNEHQEEEVQLQRRHKMTLGLAKIEGLRGTDKQEQFNESAGALQVRISEVQNLIRALDALERDLSTSRRAPIVCPRCTSQSVTYRITPSELGFTLYRCESCTNAWKITQFSIKAAGTA